MNANQIFAFGPYRLDVRERLLLKDGTPVLLTPKAFEILCVLVLKAGHLVSKEQLLSEVWRDSFVEEGSIARNVYVLRKSLGEAAEGQPYIQTVPRQGYRFVVEVKNVSGGVLETGQTEVNSAEMAVASSGTTPTSLGTVARRPRGIIFTNRFFVGLLILLVALPAVYFFAAKRSARKSEAAAVRSLAILPFKSIDAQAGDEQLSLGMADAILTKLSKLPSVSVLPTTAIFKYSGRERDPIASGQELGVDAVLDGTMQRSDGRIRVTAQLVHISNGRTLWADSFDEPLNGIFALQDSVAEQIARTLAVQIDTGPDNPASRYSKNAEAYESYLMGYFFWNKRTRENVAKAIPYLERAVERDPDFALARALLADCHLIDVFYKYNIRPASESAEKARSEAAKALALNDSIAESHIVMAHIKSLLEGDSVGAETEYKRGLALNPNYATGRIRYGIELFYSLRLEEAIREVKRGRELDPLSPAANAALSFLLIMAHDYDAAIQFGRRAVELNPTLIQARVNLGEAYLLKGMYREAFDEFERLEEFDPVRARLCLLHANAKTGRHNKARELFAQLKRSPDASSLSALDLAASHEALGEKHEALEVLEKASLNMLDLALLHFDPQWESLKSDPRFGALIKRGRQR